MERAKQLERGLMSGGLEGHVRWVQNVGHSTEQGLTSKAAGERESLAEERVTWPSRAPF